MMMAQKRPETKQGESLTFDNVVRSGIPTIPPWQTIVYGMSRQDGTPTTETQIAIESVSGSLVGTGKNLLDMQTTWPVNRFGVSRSIYGSITDGVYTSQMSLYNVASYLTLPTGTIRAGETYTISFDVLAPVTQFIYFGFRDTDQIAITTTKYVVANTLTHLQMTLTASAGREYLQQVQLQGSTSVDYESTNIIFTNIQLELGGVATSRVPYQGSYAHPMPDLPGLPNTTPPVSDTWEPCVMVDGQYRSRLTRRVGVRVLDGTENWYQYSAEGKGWSSGMTACWFLSQEMHKKSVGYSKEICSHFQDLPNSIPFNPDYPYVAGVCCGHPTLAYSLLTSIAGLPEVEK
jgi:hypothetical protein